MSAEDYLGPEDEARVDIDRMLTDAGWIIQSREDMNVRAGLGVAVRDRRGVADADYLLFVEGRAAGVLEAKKVGHTLTGVEGQSARYLESLPDDVPAWQDPLRFSYESTGVETRFTDHADPDPRSRRIFAVHQPGTLHGWLQEAEDLHATRPTLRHRLRDLPPIPEDAPLWPPQRAALESLENSFARDLPRALIQMATGSGKTYLAANSAYRLVKFGGARRVLFLVDRANLGEQAENEFAQLVTPDDRRKMSELYGIQRLTSNRLAPDAKIVISTIQRVASMLRGEPEMDPELDETSLAELREATPVEAEYNPDLPPEMFDVIIVDEAHRSIYGAWRPVLEYFDAYLVGLTATPTKVTFGFFNQNLVYEYSHEEAIADGVNVDFDVYRIRTRISAEGSTVEAGTPAKFRDRATRAEQLRILDDDFKYDPNQLDRQVVARDQIRTVVEHFRDHLFTEIFPGRTVVPKTLVFAKDDSHADDIVDVIREVFARGNDFCHKITSKSTAGKPSDLLAAFRNTYNPRIAVTVDLIATGTDVKPIECVMFMRAVKSRSYFEQMKGRGVRVINPDDFQKVTDDPAAPNKTHFVIVDAVGVTDEDKQDTVPLERKRSVSLKKLFEQVGMGSRDVETVSSIASRLARLDRQITQADRDELTRVADGTDLTSIVTRLMNVADPDIRNNRARELASEEHGTYDPSPEQVAQAVDKVVDEAVEPLVATPGLRSRILEVRRSYRQMIDEVSTDEVIDSGFDRDATDRARQTVQTWREYIEEHRRDIQALQVIYGQPQTAVPTLEQLEELANSIQRPPYNLSPEAVWDAYEQLDHEHVRPRSRRRAVADLLALLRFELGADEELRPFEEVVEWRWQQWLTEQDATSRFTDEQLGWLEAMKNVVATSVTVRAEDFDYGELHDRGGLARAWQDFDGDLDRVIEELNRRLVP